MTDTFIVVDFEATCDDRGAVPREEMEIIEIGAVRVDATSLARTGEFQLFVRPVRRPRLTPFCQKLTSIAQAYVDHAPGFPAAAAAFAAWAGAESGETAFYSWGNYDRKQLAKDCEFHGVENPLPYRHVNLKTAFAKHQGLRKPCGMAKALRYIGLPLEGTHHRGIDDARNIARLLPYALGLRDVPGRGKSGE